MVACMVACLVRDQTFSGGSWRVPVPPERQPSRVLSEQGPFADEIAIDFPAVPAIVARICARLSEEDERSPYRLETS